MLNSAYEYRFSKMLTQALIELLEKDGTLIITDEIYNDCSTSYTKEKLAGYKWESPNMEMFVYSDGEYQTVTRFGESLVVDDYTTLPKKIHYMLFDGYEYAPTENIYDIQNKMQELLLEQ